MKRCVSFAAGDFCVESISMLHRARARADKGAPSRELALNHHADAARYRSHKLPACGLRGKRTSWQLVATSSRTVMYLAFGNQTDRHGGCRDNGRSRLLAHHG